MARKVSDICKLATTQANVNSRFAVKNLIITNYPTKINIKSCIMYHSREETVSVIIKSLSDPNMFLLDSLLSTKPVQNLKGELIFDLLSIFVNNNLRDYLNFYENHNDFIKSLGLNHQENVRKMRLLTFMQLAETSSVISFDTIINEIEIQPEDVESFVIEVLKTKLVRGRMDQNKKEVIVMSTMYRTFGKQEWQQLRDVLFSWRRNLDSIQQGLKRTAAAQQEFLNQQ